MRHGRTNLMDNRKTADAPPDEGTLKHWIVAALMLTVMGAVAGCGTSPSATGTTPSASATSPSNARSGPAAGGAAGTVGSVSTASFTMSTAAGQLVTVEETPSTTYQKATSSTSASAI